MFKFIVLLAFAVVADGFINDVLSVRNQVPSDIPALAARVVNNQPALPGTPDVITAALPQATVQPEPSSPLPSPVVASPTLVVSTPRPVASPQAAAVARATATANVVVRKAPKAVVESKPVVVKKSVKPTLVIVEDADVCSTVADVAIATPELSILVAALQAANLVEVLADPSLVATIFAPTDEAFQTLIKNLNTTAEAILADSQLANILLYHVVPEAAVLSTDLVDGASVTTLLGQDLTVDLTDGVVIKAAGSEAKVVVPDVKACKAVVHVIDTVLLPDFNIIPESAIIPAPEEESGETVTLTLSK